MTYWRRLFRFKPIVREPSLSEKLKQTRASRIKAHLALTGRLREISEVDDKAKLNLLFLNDLFLKVEDNYWFWVILKANWYLLESYIGSWEFAGLENYYNAIQLWYHHYYLEEKNENVWLNFITLGKRKRKMGFNRFWESLEKEAYRQRKVNHTVKVKKLIKKMEGGEQNG